MITGTFLDEIGPDIASANWGAEEWRRDFAAMRSDGIDTVILTRSGLGDRALFDAPSLRALHPRLVVQEDLAALYLALAEEHGMDLWFGAYEPGRDARHDPVAVNRRLAGEVWERYGRSAAFRGWHLALGDPRDDAAVRGLAATAAHLRDLAGLPVVLTLGLARDGAPGERAGAQDWAPALERLSGSVDVVVFPDDAPSGELHEHLRAGVELARRHGLACWSNLESCERDVRFQTPPIAWPRLKHKMECAAEAGVARVVTYEYSRFLSPHSVFPSAHNLHRRYREWLAKNR